MDFPATPPAAASPPDGLLPALGVKAVTTARSAFDWLVEVATEDDVRDLRPDFKALAAFPVRGVIVTAAGTTPGFDFISRFFAPGAGIDEDPVTGSAHCALGPFWAGRLGRSKLLAYQASPRGGVVGVEVAGDRVLLRGQAVTVLRATLTGDAATA